MSVIALSEAEQQQQRVQVGSASIDSSNMSEDRMNNSVPNNTVAIIDENDDENIRCECCKHYCPCFSEKVEATICLSLTYLCFGLIIISTYTAFSILFYIECNELEDKSEYAFECGSIAMWSSVGWVPTLVFLGITLVTTRYLYKQSKRAIKVLPSQRAWLITLIIVGGIILYVIHICYIVWLCYDLATNIGCEQPLSTNASNISGVSLADCEMAYAYIIISSISSILQMFFVYASLLCIFGLVNGRIATSLEYKTKQQLIQIAVRKQKRLVTVQGDEEIERERHNLVLLYFFC